MFGVIASGDVVIHELMYHPASGSTAEEFIELKNVGAASVDLSGWQFTRGVNFTFPNSSLAPGEYLVIAADSAVFNSIYGTTALGNWSGTLSNRGERLTLIDADGEEVCDFTYYDQGDWAERVEETDPDILLGEDGWTWDAAHDGGGASLELISTAVPSAMDEGQLWAASVGGPTPGADNSVATNAFPPIITKTKHAPAVPTSSDSVSITAKVVDLSGTTLAVTLHYRESTSSPSSFTSVSMAALGNDVFGADLAAMSDGTIVEFYIEASDGTLSRTWPAPTETGQDANALYQVDNEMHDGSLSFYRVLMTVPDEEAYVEFDRESDAQVNSTLIAYDCKETKIRYRCGTRIRGGTSRRRVPRPMRINLPRDRSFNGATSMNLNVRYSYMQLLGQKIFQGAGMPSVKAWRVQVRRNSADLLEPPLNEDYDLDVHYGSWVHLQVLNSNYVKESFPGDAQGNLYKGDEFVYQSSPRDYDWEKITNASAADYSDLHAVMDVMINAVGDSDYLTRLEALVDLDQWLRWFAIMALLGNEETNLSTGKENDYAVYFGAEAQRMTLVPHDLDTLLTLSDHDPASFTLFDMIEEEDVVPALIDLFELAEVETRYYQAFQELVETSFSKPIFDPLVRSELTGWVPDAEIEAMLEWMDTRRAFVISEVEDALNTTITPPVPSSNETWPSPHSGDLLINEILASNATIDLDGAFPDYIELVNLGGSPIDLGGYRLTDNVSVPDKFNIPQGTMLPSGGFVVFETTGFKLDADGEAVSLIAPDGITLIDQVAFGCQIADLSIGRNSSNHWTLNVPTPGTANVTQSLGMLGALRINEWLTRTDLVYQRDYVELYNPESLPLALGGVRVQGDAWIGEDTFTFPPLSFLAQASWKAMGDLPYALDSSYGWLSVIGSEGVEIDEVHWSCQFPDVSTGRSPDGSDLRESFALPTIGRSNTDSLEDWLGLRDNLRVVGLHYDPAEGTSFEYVELKNVGSETLDLGPVRFSQGIEFSFPGMSLDPGERVILAEDRAQYEIFHGLSTPVIGQYSGKLSNDGETLRLEVGPVGFGLQQFRYEASWYPSTDGGGERLQVVNENAAAADWNLASQWQAVPVPLVDPYATWANLNLSSTTLEVAGRLADPDADGLTNLVEWAHGLDPDVSDDEGLPQVAALTGMEATFQYTRNLAAPGVTFTLQESSDLLLWVDSTVLSDLSTGAEGLLDKRELTIGVDDTEDRLFYRMEVQVSP